MAKPTGISEKSFAQLEHEGWERAASLYDDMAGRVTAGVAKPLADAASIGPGARVLEVCCGPGYVSEEALARGAEATGLDFSSEMIIAARRRVPDAQFDVGDAQDLPYSDHSFDAVCCPFGLLHLPNAEAAVAEAFRVLKDGGIYGYTVWCTPEKVAFFQLIFGAVREHGTMEVPLPEAPPIFRFSDPEEGRQVLEAAGFVKTRFSEIPLAAYADKPEEILDLVYRSTVRTPLVLQLQTDTAREKIHDAIIEGAKELRTNGHIEVPMPAVMGVAEKPG